MIRKKDADGFVKRMHCFSENIAFFLIKHTRLFFNSFNSFKKTRITVCNNCSSPVVKAKRMKHWCRVDQNKDSVNPI